MAEISQLIIEQINEPPVNGVCYESDDKVDWTPCAIENGAAILTKTYFKRRCMIEPIGLTFTAVFSRLI